MLSKRCILESLRFSITWNRTWTSWSGSPGAAMFTLVQHSPTLRTMRYCVPSQGQASSYTGPPRSRIWLNWVTPSISMNFVAVM